VYRCKFLNFTNNGISSNAQTEVRLCEATGCSSAAFESCNFYYCTAYANTSTPFGLAGGQTAVGCVAVNNTGAGVCGFNGSGNNSFDSCMSYGNAGHGFSLNQGANRATCVNCLSYSNGGYGFLSPGTFDNLYLYNCAGGNNTNGNTSNIQSQNIVNFVALTANPFINAAGNNFALNTAALGGMLLKAMGLPGQLAKNSLPGLSTLNYLDIGGIQGPDNVVSGILW
jgi:hypothetical protein